LWNRQGKVSYLFRHGVRVGFFSLAGGSIYLARDVRPNGRADVFLFFWSTRKKPLIFAAACWGRKLSTYFSRERRRKQGDKR
jgi:hypothetical protein